jgi:tetratricopeptide (TPR) repeat protein
MEKAQQTLTMWAKVFFGLIVLVFTTTLSFAQTQQGYVKTKGRMVDGKLVPGQGIKGASVTVQGRTAVLVNADDGAFSFPIPDKTFHLQEVKKNGYQLVDADIIKRSFTYSTTPIYIVMETPDQQLSDQLAAERKIRRTMQRKLEEREDEIEALKAQQKITEEEYRQALQKLYAEQESNERLIADMAKQYAAMDYDQMDELNRRISDAIVNGRLTEADSLLHSKGDINDRIKEVQREQQAEAQRQEQLNQEQADLENAQAGTQKKLEDIADDCERFFDRFKMDLQFDSAAYYIELRAELDTIMPNWQQDAAHFFSAQNEAAKAEKYYNRALNIYQILNETYANEYDEELAGIYNSLGILYSDNYFFDESEDDYLEALSLYRAMAKDNPIYEDNVALVLNNLATLYRNMRLYDASEAKSLEALEIRKRLAAANPEAYKPGLASIYNNLGVLYSDLDRNAESEAMYLNALQAKRELAATNPRYEEDMAKTLNNLAILYANTDRPAESEAMYLEALEIRRRWAKDNPRAYEPELAHVLHNLASLYDDLGRDAESETLYLEALEIYRRLADEHPVAFEIELASALNNLGILYKKTERYNDSEAAFLEAYQIYSNRIEDNTMEVTPKMVKTLLSLGELYYKTDQPEDSEAAFITAKELLKILSKDNPTGYETNLFMSLAMLHQLYLEQENYKDGYYNDLEILPMVEKRLAEGDESYQQDLVTIVGSLSVNALFSGLFPEAEHYARRSLALDPTDTTAVTLLAEALLMQGKRQEAEPYFLQLDDKAKEISMNDLEFLEDEGLIPKERKADVERVRKLLQE